MTTLGPSDYLCHGLACPKHAQCLRYIKAENAMDHIWWMATCAKPGQIDRPQFIPVENAHGDRETA